MVFLFSVYPDGIDSGTLNMLYFSLVAATTLQVVPHACVHAASRETWVESVPALVALCFSDLDVSRTNSSSSC